MGESDITWRRLLREVPDAVARIVFPRRRIRVLGPATDASVDRARRLTADNLFHIREGRRTRLLHIEVEHKWRPSLPRRLFDYASAAHALTGLPVVTAVLLLGGGGPPPRSRAYRVRGIDVDAFVFRYHVIRLGACEARRMKRRLRPEGWAFLVAMRGGKNAAFVRELAVEIEHDSALPSERRDRALHLLFLVAAAMLGAEAARSIFLMESIIQSPGVQQLIREFREEGREEGRVTEARANLLRVIARRGFVLPAELGERVAGERHLGRLELWLDAAVTARSVHEIFDEMGATGA